MYFYEEVPALITPINSCKGPSSLLILSSVPQGYTLQGTGMSEAKAVLGKYLQKEHDYQVAVQELTAGRKRSHWIWYIFPQLKGLRDGHMNNTYNLQSLHEAELFLQHATLQARLLSLNRIVLAQCSDKQALRAMFGGIDAQKFHYSLTVFCVAALRVQDIELLELYRQLLQQLYAGQLCPLTIKILLLKNPELRPLFGVPLQATSREANRALVELDRPSGSSMNTCKALALVYSQYVVHFTVKNLLTPVPQAAAKQQQQQEKELTTTPSTVSLA
jgi:uncharacterized protein (DUF1810 family)